MSSTISSLIDRRGCLYIKDSAPGEVDLHGLYVKEAIARADEAITQAKRADKSELRLIVGSCYALYMCTLVNLLDCSPIFRQGPAFSRWRRKDQACHRGTYGKVSHDFTFVVGVLPDWSLPILRHHLKAELDPHNAGVLVVEIEASSGHRGLGADEISRRLERKDESCIIM